MGPTNDQVPVAKFRFSGQAIEAHQNREASSGGGERMAAKMGFKEDD